VVAVASADAVELAEETASPAQPVSNRTPQERYSDAKPIATKLTAGLGLRGFTLNLSVESAAGFDDLLALLPKIQDAVGTKACQRIGARTQRADSSVPRMSLPTVESIHHDPGHHPHSRGATARPQEPGSGHPHRVS